MHPPVEFCPVGRHRIAYVNHNAHLLADPDVTPIAFVHGLSMSVRFWELAMIGEIRRELPWVSVSLPLHYPSTYDGDALDADVSEDVYVETLSAALRAAVGERPVRLVGHSVGAFAALAFAARVPKRCAGVLSVGGFADGERNGLQGALRALTTGYPFTLAAFRGVWRLKQRSRRFTGAVVQRYAADRAALRAYAPFAPTLDLVHPDMARHDLDGLFAMVRWLLRVDVMDEFAQIRCPVWVAAGTDDPVVDFGHQVEVAAALPRGRLFVLEGAGHLGFAERAEVFDEMLAGFAGFRHLERRCHLD